VEISSHLFTVNGRTRHLSIVRDISDREEAEQRLRDSLREKEVLLQEIHHRVKNNLQLVSSMVSLQREDLGERPAVELQTRVRAMALIHEVLYGMHDLSRIQFDEYLRTLVGELKNVYDNGWTRLELSLAAVALPIDLAVPLGLLVNEIVSNSFKHAHPPRETGTLRVELTRENGIVVRVADDGVGLQEHPRSGNSLGLVLIDELADQVGATLEVSRQGGTAYTIHIPEDSDG
jgi:two-component sensor histidine kinase